MKRPSEAGELDWFKKLKCSGAGPSTVEAEADGALPSWMQRIKQGEDTGLGTEAETALPSWMQRIKQGEDTGLGTVPACSTSLAQGWFTRLVGGGDEICPEDEQVEGSEPHDDATMDTCNEILGMEEIGTAAGIDEIMDTCTEGIDAILRRGTVTTKEMKSLNKLMAMVATRDGPITKVVFTSEHTANGKGVTWVQVPIAVKSDANVTSQTLRSRATFMEKLGIMIGWGPGALGRLLVRDKNQSATAIAGTEFASTSKCSLTALQTLDLMGWLKMSWCQVCRLRQMLKEWCAPLALASTPVMKAHLRGFAVEAKYRTVWLETGKKNSGKTVESLVVSRSMFEVMIEERDRCTFVSADLLCNQEKGSVESYVISNDYGGRMDKHTIRPLDRAAPCSVTNQLLIATAEAARSDDPKKPEGTHGNLTQILQEVDGLFDTVPMVFVQIGGRHTIVPLHTVPAGPWRYSTIELSAKPLFFEEAWGIGSTAEKVQVRAGLVNGSVVLVICEGTCLGLRSGAVTFPFRSPVSVSLTVPVSPVVSVIDMYLSADLLALATVTGMEGQSSCNCLWCSGAAAQFKTSAGPLSLDLPLRTTDSQTINLDAFQDQVNKTTPVNGVSAAPVFPFSFSRMIPPFLHVGMGPPNAEVSRIYNALVKLDNLDTVRLGNLQNLAEHVGDRELELVSILLESKSLLVAEGGLEVDHVLMGDHDMGQLVGTEALNVWSSIGTALVTLASAKAEEHERLAPGLMRDALENVPVDLMSIKSRLDVSILAVGTARASLKSGEDEPLGAGPFGNLTQKFSDLLLENNISVQCYWNGTLVGKVLSSFSQQQFTNPVSDTGPNVRRFLDSYNAIMDSLKVSMTTLHGLEYAICFHTRYCSIFEHLAVVSRLTRHVGQLSASDLVDLQGACTGYARAFREAYPGQNLTPKGHIIEKHVMAFALYYGTCGTFGEDGMEALHPLCTAVRIMTRSMRNPVARAKATSDHLTIRMIRSEKKIAKKG
jgi:hypothetical protein